MVLSAEMGTAQVWLTQLADGGYRERWLVTHTFDGGVTASHIHHGAILGANAANLVDFGSTLTSPIQGSAAVDATRVDALVNERAYVNVHTTRYGGGEIRGQLMQAGFGAGWAKLYTDDPSDGGVLAGSIQLSLPLVDAGVGPPLVAGMGRFQGRLAAGFAAASARVAVPELDGGLTTMMPLPVSNGAFVTSTFYADGGAPMGQPLVEVVLTDGGLLYGPVETAF